jgi:hypothetical protein
LPTFDEFEVSTYTSLCDELSKRAESFGNEVEGSMWLPGISFTQEREAVITILSGIDAGKTSPWHYLEVGFNSGELPLTLFNVLVISFLKYKYGTGHSAAIVLSTFHNARITSFDICAHAYAAPNYDYLRSMFGDRLYLTCGDSRRTLPAAAATHALPQPFGLADVVRVDGGHHFDVASLDLVNCRALAKPRAIIIVDDCTFVEVWAAWKFAIDLGIIEPSNPGLGWKGSCIGRYTAL